MNCGYTEECSPMKLIKAFDLLFFSNSSVMSYQIILFQVFVSCLPVIFGQALPPIAQVTSSEWSKLSSSLSAQSQLHRSYPLSLPCYTSYAPTSLELSSSLDDAQIKPPGRADLECNAIRRNYSTQVSPLSDVFREQRYEGLMMTAWEICQSKAEGCLLNWEDPINDPMFLQEGRDGLYGDLNCESNVESDNLKINPLLSPASKNVTTENEVLKLNLYDQQTVFRPPSPPSKCYQGSIPSVHVSLHSSSPASFSILSSVAQDLSHVFNFATKHGKIPIAIKNTGHDYKGRSSCPNCLGIWTKNLKGFEFVEHFVPEGCDAESAIKASAITMGAGVIMEELLEFAQWKNVSVLGGTDRTVGPSGGFLMGGGHGILSNTYGLGVDRVLEIKIVTPDGRFLTANRCQHADLFYALRGGGGSTFGVVLSSTTLASPPIPKMQNLLVRLSNKTKLEAETKEMWKVMIENSVRWAEDGWGAYGLITEALFTHPNLDPSLAQKSMEPMTEFAEKLKKNDPETQVLWLETNGMLEWLNAFIGPAPSPVGINNVLASRLIPTPVFSTHQSQAQLLDALVTGAKSNPAYQIEAVAPFVFSKTLSKDATGTSVTPAWRTSIWTVVTGHTFAWNATRPEIEEAYRMAKRSIEPLRKLTPDAAYQNEADVYEPNHKVSFWGKNYDRLLKIKEKYDPRHLLDCWQCIGWNRSSEQFSCYI